MALEQRQKAILGALAFCGVGAALTAVASLMLIKFGRSQAPLPVILLALAALAALGVALMLPYWRKLDHMARDANLISWWWGGAFGAMLALPVAVVLDPRPPAPLLQGVVLVLAIQCAATLLFWLGWWARRLPRA